MKKIKELNLDEYYMKKAYKEAKKAYKKGEVPVGAIIVNKNKVISKGYNKTEKKHDVTKHAEIEAIQKASKKIKNWRLNECTIYVTMEPCLMCKGAIINSRIQKIVYGVSNKYNKKINSNLKIVQNVCESECKDLLQSFFKRLR